MSTLTAGDVDCTTGASKTIYDALNADSRVGMPLITDPDGGPFAHDTVKGVSHAIAQGLSDQILIDGGLGGSGGGTTFDYTYPIAGGAHDYAADAEWSAVLNGYSTTTGLATSLEFGDGTDVPRMIAYGRDNISSLARTAGGAIRITASGATSQNGNVCSGQDEGANLIILLPRAEKLVLEVTVSSNSVARSSAMGGPQVSVTGGIGICHWNGNTNPPAFTARATWWQYYLNNGTGDYPNPREYGEALANAPGTYELLTSFINGSNVWTRRYRFSIDGIGAKVDSSNTALTAYTISKGATDLKRVGSFRDLMLVIGFGFAVPDSSLYFEVRDIHVSGRRAPL